VHAALALREDGYETIMINCNPETVSTDFDTSDRLYFEPLTLEDVLEIVHVEKPYGVIVQYRRADAAQARTRPRGERRADHRNHARFDRHRRGPRALSEAVEQAQAEQPPNRTARSPQRALALADEIGYPLVVRPSYVLAGARWKSFTSRAISSATCAKRSRCRTIRRYCWTAF
jgi:carbamoyl-phosphate synthase large subunit